MKSTNAYSPPSSADDFVAMVSKGNVHAAQFHPEKSGATGLSILQAFLDPQAAAQQAEAAAGSSSTRGLARRVIACLDVRSNDNGDLVVTKVGGTGLIPGRRVCSVQHAQALTGMSACACASHAQRASGAVAWSCA
jgi:hypothetical protein